MIRILHSSDWHLGRFLYGRSLLEDQEYILSRLLELIDARQPHALFLAGDIFDRSFPPEDAVMLLNSFLNATIHQRKLPIFLIPGNHDSAERVGFAAQLLREQNLTIFSRIEDALNPVPLVGDHGSTAMVYGIPFVEPVIIARLLDKPELRTHDEAIRALCERISLEHQSRYPGVPSILLCHAFVVGGESSESEKELSIGGSSQVDARAFAPFAYTALGHLHKPQNVGSPKIRYSGSLLPYSKSEVGHSKSITEVVFTPTSETGSTETKIMFHPLKSLRGLAYKEDSIENLLRDAEILQRSTDSMLVKTLDDFLIVGLTNVGGVLDAFARLRIFYPNLLHVARAGGFESKLLPSSKAHQAEQRSELDLFAEFFKDATGENLSDEERATLINCLMEPELAFATSKQRGKK